MRLLRKKLWLFLLALSLLFTALEGAGPLYAGTSKRLLYVGRTPGKNTRVGREVLKRWHESGKAKWKGKKGEEPDYSQHDKWKVKVYTFDSVTRTMSSKRQWLPLDHNIAMGHKLAAVDFWNNGAAQSQIYSPIGRLKSAAIRKARYEPYQEAGRTGEAKSEAVRRFMLDSSNYRFEHLPANSHFGALMQVNYLPPED